MIVSFARQSGLSRAKAGGRNMQVAYTDAKQLAANIRETQQSIDTALSRLTEMTATIMNVCMESQIHPAKSQAAIEEATNGLVRMVDARKGFVAAHRQIVKVQRDSDLATIDFGCVGPDTLMKRTELRVVNS
jgi:hypothetical protein